MFNCLFFSTSCLFFSDEHFNSVSQNKILEDLNQVLSQIMMAVQQLVKNNIGVEVGVFCVDFDIVLIAVIKFKTSNWQRLTFKKTIKN